MTTTKTKQIFIVHAPIKQSYFRCFGFAVCWEIRRCEKLSSRKRNITQPDKARTT